MKKMELLKLNLQYFADDPEQDTEPEAEAGSEPEKEPEDTKKQDPRQMAKYSDEDLDRIISRKIAQERKKQDEAQRLANMTAEEKQAEETRQLREELAELKRSNAQAGMLREARSLLSGKGINVSDDLITMLIGEDADSTKASIESFTDLFNKAVDARVKEALKGNTPKATEHQSSMTKEQIMAIKNTAARQKAIRENMELFK